MIYSANTCIYAEADNTGSIKEVEVDSYLIITPPGLDMGEDPEAFDETDRLYGFYIWIKDKGAAVSFQLCRFSNNTAPLGF